MTRSQSPSSPTVSIVVATYNRLDRLMRCVEGVRRNVGIDHEMVIVGGATEDGTAEWVANQPDLRFIRETQRLGATKAYNLGFREARGQYIMWLNDDSFPLPGAVSAAVSMIERDDLADVGMVAFYHNFDRPWNRLDSIEHEGETYSLYNVRGSTYANFGLLRRDLLEQLDYLDERYYFCGWDPDLSMKVQREAGLNVIGCRQALVFHEELIDERKSEDLQKIVEADNATFFAKWSLPDKFSYADPAPAYQSMIRQRALS